MTCVPSISWATLWMGKVCEYKNRWGTIWGAMRADLGPAALRGLLVEQKSKSKDFESGVTTYYREDDKKTYSPTGK